MTNLYSFICCRSHLLILIGAGVLVFTSACSSLKQTAAVAVEAPTADAAVSGPERALLNMSYEEASAISKQHLVVPPLFKIAADSIEVVKKGKDGAPVEVVAKGNVFVDMSLKDRATGMCESATVTDKSVVMAGRPIIKRSNRVAKGTSENARFVISVDRLKALGTYQLATVDEVPLESMTLDEAFPELPPLTLPTPTPFVASAENSLLPSINSISGTAASADPESPSPPTPTPDSE